MVEKIVDRGIFSGSELTLQIWGKLGRGGDNVNRRDGW
jgi:hypothetical protein